MSTSSQERIALNCVYCGKLIQVASRLSGETVRCRCGAMVNVPLGDYRSVPFRPTFPDPVLASPTTKGRTIDPLGVAAFSGFVIVVLFCLWSSVAWLFRGPTEQEFYAERERTQVSGNTSENTATSARTDTQWQMGYDTGKKDAESYVLDRFLGGIGIGSTERETERRLEKLEKKQTSRFKSTISGKSRQFVRGYYQGFHEVFGEDPE